MKSEQEPIGSNEDLARLAAKAKSEDSVVEEEVVNEVTGDIQTPEDQQKAAEEAAERLAMITINGMAWAVKASLGVTYDDELKREGVEKLKPCLSGDGDMPAWLVSLLDRYGKYFEAGAFFVGVGMTTYQIVKEREDSNDKEPNERESQTGESTYPVPGVDGLGQVAMSQTAITDT